MDLFAFDTSPFDIFAQQTQILLFAEALNAYLFGNGLQAWCLHVPQNIKTSPQLTYALDRRQSFYTVAGTTRLVQATYSLDAIGTDKLDVDTLAEKLRGVLQGFSGPFGGMTISGCRLEKKTYSYVPTSYGSDVGTHIVKSEYVFFYTRN